MTESCCKITQEPKKIPPCPANGVRGRRVETRTLLYLLKGKFLKELSPNETYYFCSVPDCDVVYYSGNSHVFKKDQIRIPVGQKEKENPQVCYCFNFFVSDLREEMEATGKATIPDFIRQKVKEEACSCEILNPQGACCLGNVSQAVKRIEKERLKRR